MARIQTALKALRELGPEQVSLYARYQARLRLGLLRFPAPEADPGRLALPLLPVPAKEKVAALIGPSGLQQLGERAEELLAGQVRLFSGPPVPLQLAPPGPNVHWTEYELGRQAWGVDDVKMIWEPARFSWAYDLARAYHLTGDERLPQAFWQRLEAFLQANPPYTGPNWASAQEAALRLLALVFNAGVFAASPHSTADRLVTLAQAVAAHAARIPPSLEYARAQHNNHLLSEAAGLYTAALALPEHPQAVRWRHLGRRWFERAVLDQFSPSGEYAQHSANYHRLALQLALWVHALAVRENRPLSTPVLERLAAATRWLQALCDPLSGAVPNLGPNDGAYILPFTNLPFADYRPVLQASAVAFLGTPALSAGEWDEMSTWLALEPAPVPTLPEPLETPLILRGLHSWAYLRAARFTSRPGHADQLHLDVWWQGWNLACDAGTYLYNAPPPWQNALAHTAVHNTLVVAGQDQMSRAGRFLWLDWAQAEVLVHDTLPAEDTEKALTEHNGYRRLGLRHSRQVTRTGDTWLVEDGLRPTGSKEVGLVDAALHWLLPDWAYTFTLLPDGASLQLQPPGASRAGPTLLVQAPQDLSFTPQLIRAGNLLEGEGEIDPTWGWRSPTYSVKIPALALRLLVRGRPPFTLTSRWLLPGSLEEMA